MRLFFMLFTLGAIISCSNYQRVKKINTELINNLKKDHKFIYCAQKSTYRGGLPEKHKPHKLLYSLNKYAKIRIQSDDTEACSTIEYEDFFAIYEWLKVKKKNKDIATISKIEYDSIKALHEQEEINRILNIKE